MRQISATTRNIIMVVVILIIAGVYYGFSFKPKYDQIQEQKATIVQQQQTYADLKRVVDQKPLYLALQKQIQQRLRGVELTADPRAYIPSYLKQIEDLAKRDGMTVTAVVPINTPAPAPTASGAPTAPPVSNIAPIRNAANVAGGEAMRGNQYTNTAAQAGGPTPVGQTPLPTASGAGPVGAPGAATPKPGSARAAAISYLNQSFTQVPVNMEFQGNYVQLQRFLRDLNKFPKLIGVGDVSLSPSSSQTIGTTPLLHITLPIIAYRLSPNAPGAATPLPTATPAP